MQSMKEFVLKHGIHMRCKHAASNPHMDSGGSHMDHWKCSLTRGRSRMTIAFSMGSGHGGREPSVDDVLSSVALEASGYENNRNFEEWASEYGYDSDSRSAHKTFNAVKKQTAKLKKFLGDSVFQELLYETENN